MPRQARLDAPGTLHHVIIRGIEKKKIVKDDEDKREFVPRMGDLSTQEKTNIYAWALMTNHAHILLRSGPSSLSGFMKRFLAGCRKLHGLLAFPHLLCQKCLTD